MTIGNLQLVTLQLLYEVFQRGRALSFQFDGFSSADRALGFLLQLERECVERIVAREHHVVAEKGRCRRS